MRAGFLAVIAGPAAEQHLAVGVAGVVIAGAREHRVRRRRQYGAGLLVLGGQAVIGDVAGDKDRVQWPGQTVQVGHDGGGPVEAALAAGPDECR